MPFHYPTYSSRASSTGLGGIVPGRVASSDGLALLDGLRQSWRHADVAPSTLSDSLVDRLAQASVAADARQLFERVHRLRAQGMTAEWLCTTLLTAIARRLGDQWLEDRLDIAAVTHGALRLHRLLHELAPHFTKPGCSGTGSDGGIAHLRPGPRHGRALLLPVPGEQHSLGLSVVAELFRAAGWPVRSLLTPNLVGLRSVMRQSRYALIGLSISGGHHVDTLAACVRCIREDPRHRDCVVMVGGTLLATDPSLLAEMPIDLICVDGGGAPQQAARLLRDRERARLVAQGGRRRVGAFRRASGRRSAAQPLLEELVAE